MERLPRHFTVTRTTAAAALLAVAALLPACQGVNTSQRAEPRADTNYVDDERVNAQVGGFYGGWITSDIVGPFKGPPGTRGW